MTTLNRNALLGAIREDLQRHQVTYDKDLEKWASSIKAGGFSGYSPFRLPISCAFAAGMLYCLEGDKDYVQIARDHLVNYRQFTGYYPENSLTTRPEYAEGIPPVPSFFALWQYVKAYHWIQKSPCLKPGDHRVIASIVSDSVRSLFVFPEWGAHNRAVLRALCLGIAAQTFPGDPAAAQWEQMARVLIGDNLRHWNIEDSALYHATWMHALIWYVDTCPVADFFAHPTTRYYFEYFKQLLAPSGGLADFGDSDWHSNAMLYVACLARGAREYQDGELTFAAQTVFDTVVGQSGKIPAGEGAISTCLWVDDTVRREPTAGSGDLLDELVGKKIVFRSGWKPESSFLLLNYKPETDFGVTQREYLKNTLSVETEKAHHGHSDENSICLLMHDRSVLLHDGGYRERLPNGKYRADYYHNRLVLREEQLGPDTPVLPFLEYDGKHHPVETTKVDFQAFTDVEMSRTRVLDRDRGYCWDRGVVYLKDREWFALFDGVTFLECARAKRERTISLSNLLFTGEILSQGANHFDTRITKLRELEVPDNSHLLTCFPQADGESLWVGSQQIRRYYQDEVLIHASCCRRVTPGDYVALVTVLVPHEKSVALDEILKSISVPPVDSYPEAVGLRVVDAKTGEGLLVGMKLNLASELVAENIRPRYTWESGGTSYGDVETDAHFFWCRQRGRDVSYAFTEGVRLSYRGQELFAAKQATFPLQYVGEDTRVGVSKWRAWEGTAQMK